MVKKLFMDFPPPFKLDFPWARYRKETLTKIFLHICMPNILHHLTGKLDTILKSPHIKIEWAWFLQQYIILYLLTNRLVKCIEDCI